ncbi:hypothetical protein MRX96_047781 [Rhipicephalus microplus]
MEVQVNEEDISPEEFLEGTDWCTIGSKTQVNRANAQSNTQNGAFSCIGEEADYNRQRSRRQPPQRYLPVLVQRIGVDCDLSSSRTVLLRRLAESPGDNEAAKLVPSITKFTVPASLAVVDVMDVL